LAQKRLLLRAIVVTAACVGLVFLLSILAIQPMEGAGSIPPESFRYRLGLWINRYAFVVMCVACWPGALAVALGLDGPVVGFLFALGFPATGATWVMLWEYFARRAGRG
jgi:hypothetical protein